METKHQRVIALLEKHNLDVMLIQQISNFAWVTDGAASYINTATTNGVGTLLITKDTRYLITDNIEAPRFEKEEQLKAQGWEFHIHQWDRPPSDIISKLTSGLRIGADGTIPGTIDLSSELVIERSYLDTNEQERFRKLSALCAEAMDEAIRVIKPGISEYEIVGLLSDAANQRGVLPTVILIATDERIFNFRHPLPTSKKLDKYAMLILCGRQHGLVCSLTRLIHFGPLPEELKEKERKVAYIDAAMITATRPGKTVAEVFQATKEAYAQVGYSDEWRLHHQGGPAGYDPREFIATNLSDVPVGVGQAYAWNPSITGTKSEDTILVGRQENEIISVVPGWPTISIEVDDQVIKRPVILVIE
jgi:antitoxin VapB